MKSKKFSKFSMSNLYSGFTCLLSFELKKHNKKEDHELTHCNRLNCIILKDILVITDMASV